MKNDRHAGLLITACQCLYGNIPLCLLQQLLNKLPGIE
jgi:hypothetical protein